MSKNNLELGRKCVFPLSSPLALFGRPAPRAGAAWLSSPFFASDQSSRKPAAMPAWATREAGKVTWFFLVTVGVIAKNYGKDTGQKVQKFGDGVAAARQFYVLRL
jgi:hypothetical protein